MLTAASVQYLNILSVCKCNMNLDSKQNLCSVIVSALHHFIKHWKAYILSLQNKNYQIMACRKRPLLHTELSLVLGVCSNNMISLSFEFESLMYWFTFYLCLTYPHWFPTLLPQIILSFTQMCKSNPVLLIKNALVYVLYQQACVASFSCQMWASHLFFCAFLL